MKRDAVYFLINDWPGRKAKSEPEIVPGYEYKDKSTAIAEVGSNKFEFFTKNEGTAGGAWLEQQPDEERLVDAMRKSAEIIVIGTSKRGTTDARYVFARGPQRCARQDPRGVRALRTNCHGPRLRAAVRARRRNRS